ncbi:amino acid ABC transporter permease [Gandjariella thermophila]|uniref:amino acid ABC transporter permease n=1 Tax=Gandjariella thermophila TaxID=1931992 RepID=UPI0010F97F0C|nr:amino acid ABC transporter permease [Gandjariella thermophila]
MDVLVNNWPLFAEGFVSTIELFALAAIGSLVLGTILATMRVSPVPVLRTAGAGYVNIVRNTPLTLVFFFFVFAYPRLGLVELSFFTLAVVSLTVYTAAFVCETVRAGINTVPLGQGEASRALGLTFPQTLISVVVPQAFRSVVPPLTSVMIALLKNTTIAAGFSVHEAGAITPALSERGEPILLGMLWIVIGFLILVLPLSAMQRTLEKRWRVAR